MLLVLHPDNFQQLYEWAVELIKNGLAYVCHQRVDEVCLEKY